MGYMVIFNYFAMGIYIMVLYMFMGKLNNIPEWTILLSVTIVMGNCSLMSLVTRRSLSWRRRDEDERINTFSQLRYHTLI